MKTALEYDQEKFDAFGWDKLKNYAPMEWWEFELSDSFPDVMDISKIITGVVTARDEQKVVLLIQGKQGAGKSILALAILWLVALRLAYYKWHDLTRWREIYDYVTNTAIMLREDTDYLIKNMQKGKCYLLDDVYDALAASEWYEQTHKAINSIMMADRTDSTVTIITVPRGSWIDRIVRGIAGYRCDVKRNEAIKELGYNQFKFVLLEWNEWSSKQVPNTPYLKTSGTVWEDAYYAIAPVELVKWYRAARSIKLEALKEEKRKPQMEEKYEKETVGDLLREYLKENITLLEKKANGKYYSSQYITDKFVKEKGYPYKAVSARPIIKEVRKEMKVLKNA